MKHSLEFLYIGGTPYESNILYLKDFTESSGSFKFLHKDYIGSILAISDEAGNKLEQRHFDAWGNFTHLQIGNGSIITDKNSIDVASLLVDRGYTSHEHFAEVGIIHMNGRLYDPLLRRFLNADEYIQDPYNTQNYNKYGYVMNNPLMFNDPSGEVWAAGFFLTWVAPILWGTLVGTAVSAGLYIVKSLITGSWSWNGFARTLLIGAVSGGATGGILGTMSATSFTGAAIFGSMSGGISGGIDALFNGRNFFTGLYKGAVLGAAIGGIGYSINYFASGSYKTKYFSRDSVSNSNDFTYDPFASKETMQETINTMRADNFTKEEIQEFGVGKDLLARENVDKFGYVNPGNGQNLAYTTPKDFITGKSDILYSPIAAQNISVLALSMVHETGHAYGNALGLIDTSIDRKKYNISYRSLDTTQHFAIAKLEHIYAKYNLLNYSSRNPRLFVDYEDVNITEYFRLPSELKSLVDESYQRLLPVFQRFMHYKR